LRIEAVAATSDRAGRFSAGQWWPADLLTALATHGARLAEAEHAAICVWSPHGDRRDIRSVSTSSDPAWLAAVAQATRDARASAAPYEQRADGRALAVVGLSASGLEGVALIGRAGPDGFSPKDLTLLADVGRLAVAALDERARPPAPRAAAPDAPAATRPPAGDFHHRLPQAFQRLEGLPALSESRDTLLAVLDDPSPSRAAIIAAIESDVALLIAVLRLANEARGNGRPSIWSVPDAVEVLTPEGVETMARRITVFDFFQRIRGWAVPPEHFRLHAVATQRAAARLARIVDHPQPDQLLVAALLHDIGKLVLMEAFASYPDQVLTPSETPEQRLQVERRALGLDHQMAGGVLLRRWRLPERLATIVGSHHDAGEDRDAALVGLSDALAHSAYREPVAPRELERTARAAGVTDAQLRTVMYEMSQPDGRRQVQHATPSPLTKRERDMLRELAKGLTYKQIALAVDLSTSTVRTHLHNTYKKLGVSDRAQAVLTATERGWL
jgi:putative nucleotidyltransferase with HDIG domain